MEGTRDSGFDMGISDDIKPKKIKSDDTPVQEADNVSSKEEKPLPDQQAVEISIDKTGLNKPVYEDLYPPLPDHPFSHLENAPEDDNEKLKEIKKTDPPAPKPSNKSFEDHYNSPQNVHKKPVLLIVFIALFMLSLASLLIWQNIDQVRSILHLGNASSNSSSSSGKSSNAGVEVISNQDYTGSSSSSSSSTDSSSSSSNTSATTATETQPDTTETPAATTASNVSLLKVSVLNGNGISGSAASVRDTLIAAGYNVSRLANASSFNYQSTTIYYNTGKKTEADAAAQLLSNRTVVSYENASVAKTYDLVIVVGKN